MDLEQIVQRILIDRRDLTRSEVLERIYDKKRSAEGYFLDEAAARIVAFELGVLIENKQAGMGWKELAIEKLVSGLNDVTVTGRVLTTQSSKTFSRSDLTKGKVMRMLIADKTGTLKMVLWDEKATLVEDERIAPGQIIRVSHGYIREGFDGKLELHVGDRGQIEISPKDVLMTEYPSINSFIEKISAINGKHRKTSILGVVQRIYPVSEFMRVDGSHGKVSRLQLQDETGQITVVFWNEKVDEVDDVKTGDYLRIMNVRVKELSEAVFELHTDKISDIAKIKTGKY